MYLEHFGFTGQPFQLTPDARFWFESRTHRRAMAYLGYGLAQSEGFIVLTGEIGAGKSTLAAYLLASIDRARLNAITLVSTQVGADDLLRMAAQRLGIASEGDKSQLLDAIEQRLIDELRAGKRTLLIVDEAQNLPVAALEELRLLSNFQVAGRALIQILLLGQPEFRDRLAGPGLEQLRQRVIASHHLEAMALDEVQAYIQHRLHLAGGRGRPGFTPEAFAAIHRLSGGIPRRINQLAQRLLLHAAVEREEVIGEPIVAAVASELNSRPDEPQANEAVLPLRSVGPPPPAANETSPPADAFASDPQLARRIATLEERAETQEATLRRVLGLLVDWVEGAESVHRTNAA
ncbi:MAG: ExeA family protein [Sphingosinicella sp.]